MAWFGKFALGAFSGVALSAAIGIPVVHYSENGGVSAVGDDLRHAGVAMREVLRDGIGAEGPRPVSSQPEPEIAQVLDKSPSILQADRIDQSTIGAFKNMMASLVTEGIDTNQLLQSPEQALTGQFDAVTPVLSGMMANQDGGSALSQLLLGVMAMDPNNPQMNSLQVQPGETTEQALKRELDRVSPLVMNMMANQSGNNPAMAMLKPVIDNACDDSAATGRNAALQGASCANIRKMMRGEFPFGLNTESATGSDITMFSMMSGIDPATMKDKCSEPPLEGLSVQQLQIRQQICAKVLSTNAVSELQAVTDILGGGVVPKPHVENDRKALQQAALNAPITLKAPKTIAAPTGDEFSPARIPAGQSPLPAARPSLAAGPTPGPIQPGPNWSKLPKRIQEMGPAKLFKKCQEDMPAGMPEVMKQLTRQICIDAFN